MQAVWYETTGPAREVLRVGARATPEPAAGEVRVRIHVSGVNPSDVKSRAGLRGPMRHALQIPHSDGAGIIDRVGAGVSPSRLGERVYVWNAAWERASGSCAEYVCLPQAQAVALPSGVDFTLGASIGIPIMTACHAVFADGDTRGRTVLVTGGAGAVGRHAIQLAKWGGARVIATVSGEQKGRIARDAGADLVIDYRREDVAARIEEFTANAGVDRIVEVEFGGNLAVSRRVLKDGAVIAAYGSMAQPNPPLPFYELMFKHVQLRLLLVYRLSVDERNAAVAAIDAALRANALTPLVAARFPLEEAARAHELAESAAVVGKILIDVG